MTMHDLIAGVVWPLIVAAIVVAITGGWRHAWPFSRWTKKPDHQHGKS